MDRCDPQRLSASDAEVVHEAGGLSLAGASLLLNMERPIQDGHASNADHRALFRKPDVRVMPWVQLAMDVKASLEVVQHPLPGRRPGEKTNVVWQQKHLLSPDIAEASQHRQATQVSST